MDHMTARRLISCRTLAPRLCQFCTMRIRRRTKSSIRILTSAGTCPKLRLLRQLHTRCLASPLAKIIEPQGFIRKRHSPP